MSKTYRLAFVRDGAGVTNAHVRASRRERHVEKKRVRQEGHALQAEALADMAEDAREAYEAAVFADLYDYDFDSWLREDEDVVDEYYRDVDLMRDDRIERERIAADMDYGWGYDDY